MPTVTILNASGISMILSTPLFPGEVLVPSPGGIVVPANFWTAWKAANWDNFALMSGQLTAV